MLNSNVTASPGRQHVPASESWVQTTAAPEPSFSLSTWHVVQNWSFSSVKGMEELGFPFPSASV